MNTPDLCIFSRTRSPVSGPGELGERPGENRPPLGSFGLPWGSGSEPGKAQDTGQGALRLRSSRGPGHQRNFLLAPVS